MCIAIPGKISKILDEHTAEVDFGGVFREVNLVLVGGADEVGVDEYVLVHVGYAISVISEEEARLTIEAFDSILEAVEADETARQAGHV